MQKYHIPINPKSDCFAMLGELVTRWGWLENQTGVIIREILRITRPSGRMVVGRTGMKGKLGAIRSLAQHHYPDSALGTELVDLANKIQAFDKYRNNVVHGLWVYCPQKSEELALLSTEGLQELVDPRPDKGAVTELPERITKLCEIQLEALRLTDVIKALPKKG